MPAFWPVVLQLELKYCERCGALYLRERGAGDPYCNPCDKRMRRLPRLRGERRVS